MPELKIKIIPEKETYNNTELARILGIAQSLHMPMFELTTVNDMVIYINSRILAEYTSTGATEYDTETGRFV